MPADVLLSGPGNSDPLQESEEDLREYVKIIQLRDQIRDGMHPRFKPANRPGSSQPTTPQLLQKTPSASSDGAQLSQAPGLHAPQCTDLKINNVLLTKSDVPAKASELKLKRGKIERELQKRKLEIEAKAWTGAEPVEHINLWDSSTDVFSDQLESIMKKAGISFKETIRSVNSAPSKPIAESNENSETAIRAGNLEAHQDRHMSRKTWDGPVESALPTVVEASRRPPKESFAPRQFNPEKETSSAEESTSQRLATNTAYEPQKAQAPAMPSPKDANAPLDVNNDGYEPAPAQERPYSPPASPRYSATSHLKSPAAPQPVRPANMARVESQGPRGIVEIEDDGDEIPYSRYAANPERELRRDNVSPISPIPLIKQEPSSPPFPDVHPSRVTRVGGPTSAYDERHRHDYHPIPPPPPRYGYQSTVHSHPPAAGHPVYDPFEYPLPPPPPPPPPPPASGYTRYPPYDPEYYHTPRPYVEYDRRYTAPSVVPSRLPTRSGRRSASPVNYPQRSPRSISPSTFRNPKDSRPLSRAEYRPPSRMARPPSPRLDMYGRSYPPPQPPMYRPEYPADYASYYGPSRERPAGYYDPYRPMRFDEYPPRPESSVIPRGFSDRNYRTRDYPYVPARPSMPPPPQSVTGGYAPEHRPEYPSSSRASVRPEDHLERRVEYRPEAGRASPRREDRPYYNGTDSYFHGRESSVRHGSVRPEPARAYGDGEYAPGRQTSVRPDAGFRDRFADPGPREPGHMQPPHLNPPYTHPPLPPPPPFGGSGYSEGRYGGNH